MRKLWVLVALCAVILVGVAVAASAGAGKGAMNNEAQVLATSNTAVGASNAGSCQVTNAPVVDVCYIQFCRQRQIGGGLVFQRCTNAGKKPNGCCTYDCVTDPTCTDLTCPPLVCHGECP